MATVMDMANLDPLAFLRDCIVLSFLEDTQKATDVGLEEALNIRKQQIGLLEYL